MGSSDKTRNKLMESMRKTKAGVSKNAAAPEKEVKTQAPSPVVPKKVAQASQAATNRAKQTGSDPYQSRTSRIWPD